MLYNEFMQPKYYGAAAEYNKPKFALKGRLFKVVGLVFLLLIVLMSAIAIVGLINSGPSNNLASLIVRQQQLQKFIAANQKSIHSSELAKLSAEASLFLTSDSTTLKGQLMSRYGVANISQEITKRETDTTSANKLKAAIQVNKFDSTYADILRDKLAATIELARIVERESGSNLKAAAQQSIKNLQAVDTQLSAVQ